MSEKNNKSILEKMGESQVWKSIIRSGVPRTRRQRMHAILGSVFLHLHPARLPKHAVKVGYTWCMGGLSFFLFVIGMIGQSYKNRFFFSKTLCEFFSEFCFDFFLTNL